MAFEIKIKAGDVPALQQALWQQMQKSRFTFIIEPKACYSRKYKAWLNLMEIRLRAKKDFCGNHPSPCPVVGGKKHVVSRKLEGLDWVSFNDMINDVLDELRIVADVKTTLCIIRKGAERRIVYGEYLLGNGINKEWTKDTIGGYADRRGLKSGRSDYPPGTPGLDGWSIELVDYPDGHHHDDHDQQKAA